MFGTAGVNGVSVLKIVAPKHDHVQSGKYVTLSIYTNIHIFRHLKLEIALAISSSNELKIEASNSTEQEIQRRGWRPCGI